MQDSVDCINIYSKGKTELGRLLSNFANTPVDLPEGRFASIEGYWYWLSCHDDRLKSLYGFQAKELGRTLPKSFQIANFEAKIKYAIWRKIESNPQIKQQLICSSLPFAHFYEYGDKQIDAGYKWLIQIWEDARIYYQFP